jgi:PAS domain-containing protein
MLDVGLDFSRAMIQYSAAWNESYDLWKNYQVNPNVSQILSPTYSVNSYFDTLWANSLMATYQVNLIGFYAINGSLLASRTYNIERNVVNYDVLPQEMSKFPFPLTNFTNPMSRSYGILTPSSGKAYLLIAVPITTDFFEGPVNTIGVYGRQITPAVLQDIATRTQLCITPYFINNSTRNQMITQIGVAELGIKNLTVSFSSQDWVDTNIGSTSVLTPGYPHNLLIGRYCWNKSGSDTVLPVESLTETVFAGFNVYSDITGNVTTYVRLDVPRPLQSLSTTIVTIIVILLLFVAAVTFIIVFILLVVLVIYRLFTLTKQIREIWVKEDFSLRVAVAGGKTDEIGLLTTVINNMLETIEASQDKISKFAEKLGREQEKIKIMLNVLPDPIMLVFPENNQFYYINATFEKVLGWTFKDLESKGIKDVIPELDTEQLMKGGVTTNVICKNGEQISIELISTNVEIDIDRLRQVTLLVLRTKQGNQIDDEKKTNKELIDLKKVLCFDESYQNKEIRDGYRKFLTKSKFSVNELDFLDDVEEYRNLDQIKRVEKAKEIEEKYITNNVKLGLNTEDTEALKASLAESLGELRLFQKYETKIKLRLVNESFTRFESEYNAKRDKKK